MPIFEEVQFISPFLFSLAHWGKCAGVYPKGSKLQLKNYARD
jgi:hypothetical protein